MKFFKLASVVSVCSLLLLSAGMSQAQDEGFSEEQERAIEAIVRDYILSHPEIIPEAVRILQERQRAQRGEMRLATIIENRAEIENDGISPELGNPNGDVTIVEYYDYRCPFCVRSHPNIIRLLAEDANLRVVFKQFPVKDEPGSPPVSSKLTARSVRGAMITSAGVPTRFSKTPKGSPTAGAPSPLVSIKDISCSAV